MSTDFNTETLDVQPLSGPAEVSGADLLDAVFPKTPVWPLVLAWALATATAAAAAVLAYNGGVVFGPWQGAYLDLDFPYRAPLISLWYTRA
ncbi:MAG: hypothetical protein FJY92_09110, partial [Candidatus Hydrogenedentes bacterium]|nr:hypothetical protein [Candidatus Hydrogenedentota bacterium]